MVHPPGATRRNKKFCELRWHGIVTWHGPTGNAVLESCRMHARLQYHSCGTLHGCAGATSSKLVKFWTRSFDFNIRVLTLRGQLECLAPGQAHHDAAVCHGLEHETDERRA